MYIYIYIYIYIYGDVKELMRITMLGVKFFRKEILSITECWNVSFVTGVFV